MAFEAFRQRIGSIIGGFDAAQAHRRLRGFRASRAHVNTLIAASGVPALVVRLPSLYDLEAPNPRDICEIILEA